MLNYYTTQEDLLRYAVEWIILITFSSIATARMLSDYCAVMSEVYKRFSSPDKGRKCCRKFVSLSSPSERTNVLDYNFVDEKKCIVYAVS